MSTILQDQFTGPPGRLLSDHTPNAGGPWSSIVGGLALDGQGSTQWLNAGGIYNPTIAVNSAPIALTPAYNGHLSTIGCNLRWISQDHETDEWGILARYQDADNYWALFYDGGELQFFAIKMLAGMQTVSQLVTSGFDFPAHSCGILLELNGADLICTVIFEEGPVQLVITDDTDPLPETGRAGIYGRSADGASATSGLHLGQFWCSNVLAYPPP